MTEALPLKIVVRELRKRRKQKKKFLLKDFLFAKQLDFVEDPAPFKTAVNTRRSGKTVGCAADLVNTAQSFPKVICLYITLSRNNAKKLIWKKLQGINREYKLGARSDETALSLTFPNGSIIYCSGASDKTEIEKFRGLALKKCYIDEAQSFPSYIKELIDDVIAPALMDYGGSLCLTGTPGPIPTGYFHQCAHAKEWSHHVWSFFDNPYIPKLSGMSHQDLLERELKRRGVTVDNPGIQREWFGRWVLDSDSLVLHYNYELNDVLEIPAGKYVYIMGVDVGFDDADAIAILAWSQESNITYLVKETINRKQGITELIGQIALLRTKYDVSKIVMDTGGLGKKIAEEMIRRYQIPIVAADKARKFENIALMNDALRTGQLKAITGSRFGQDCMLLEYDLDKSTPDKLVISNRYHSDIIDAALYAWRESYAFSFTAPVVKPKLGTPEWAKQEAIDLEDKAEEFFKEQETQEKEWGW